MRKGFIAPDFKISKTLLNNKNRKTDKKNAKDAIKENIIDMLKETKKY